VSKQWILQPDLDKQVSVVVKGVCSQSSSWCVWWELLPPLCDENWVIYWMPKYRFNSLAGGGCGFPL